jgi:hypothetical protein
MYLDKQFRMYSVYCHAALYDVNSAIHVCFKGSARVRNDVSQGAIDRAVTVCVVGFAKLVTLSVVQLTGTYTMHTYLVF